MEDKRWGDKITPQNITRDYDDVISRNQIRGSKMAVLKLALLGEQELLHDFELPAFYVALVLSQIPLSVSIHKN